MQTPIIQVKDLQVHFNTFEGASRVLEGVNLRVDNGQRVGLVGESGCGKSVTMKAIMGTLTSSAVIAGGNISFEGHDLLGAKAGSTQMHKGSDISMIFQDPMTSLNPVFRIGQQLYDISFWSDRRQGLRRRRSERRKRVVEALRRVRLPDPERIYDAYPVQLSGGMRQRVLIGMALLNEPRFLIADEPGTALDVTTQDEILQLINDLVREQSLSLLMISHNLGVVRNMTDYLYVMYAGRVIEHGTTKEIFRSPQHPYTQALFACVPKLSGARDFMSIEGTLPDYTDPPHGCRFHPRCPHAMPKCQTRPPDFLLSPSHASACWLQETVAI